MKSDHTSFGTKPKSGKKTVSEEEIVGRIKIIKLIETNSFIASVKKLEL